MIYDLINEYLKCAQVAAWVDYSDQESLRLYNTVCERMRAIVLETVSLGQDAVLQFASILDNEPAALWAAHHLVELANLNSATLLKCFARVEQSRLQAKLKGNLANARGEEMWLKNGRQERLKLSSCPLLRRWDRLRTLVRQDYPTDRAANISTARSIAVVDGTFATLTAGACEQRAWRAKVLGQLASILEDLQCASEPAVLETNVI